MATARDKRNLMEIMTRLIPVMTSKEIYLVATIAQTIMNRLEEEEE